ncbi:MAG: hypothetical protein FWD82_10260 [Defluviitaleaceae bacterium]|nr:hypothetical protein [Defluviitaleaceae bacterium]
MKNIIFCGIYFISLFLLGCVYDIDPYIETEIEIKNESSFNLHITFKSIHFGAGGFERQFDVKKEASVVFWLTSGQKSEGVQPRNPNKENIYINIFNADTKRLLKQLENDSSLFEFIKSDNRDNIIDYYIFKITDELLSE